VKLHRIKLTDYRGVEGREVAFADVGVTIVEGPNEVGKSCIAEAFDLLLEELDSSEKRRVLDVQPVDRDAGPEIEAEFTTGDYRLNYRKRFVKRPITELEILAPNHEHVNGRQAHERVRAILDETLDEGLWKAVRIQQGSDLAQPNLASVRSLASALDRAAGAVPTGDEDIALFERVHQEYQQFWTETGRAKQDHGALERPVAERSEDVRTIERQLEVVQRDVERVASLEAEIASLVAQVDQQQQRVNELEGQLRVLRDLESARAALITKATTADAQLEQAVKALAERRQMASEIEEARQRVASHAGTLAALEPDLVDARAAHEADVARLEVARRDCDDWEALSSRRRNDVRFLRDRADFDRLSGRVEVAREALAKLGQIQQSLQSNTVDEPALRSIRTADLQLRTVRAQLEGSRPVIRAVVREPLSLQIDDARIDLAAGEELERPFAKTAQVTVPGHLELQVSAGGADPRLLDKVRKAENTLVEACRAVGVPDLATAEQAATERRRLEVDAQLTERSLTEALGASPFQELSTTAANLEARVAAYATERPLEPPLIEDLSGAERQADDAESQATSKRAIATEAERLESGSRDRLAEASEALNNTKAVAPVLQENLERLEARLTTAQRDISDDSLLAANQDAERAASNARAAVTEAQAELDEMNGPQLITLAGNAGQVQEQMRSSLSRARDERLELIGALRERGQDGLAEQLDVAITALDAAVATLSSYERRAAARKILYEALCRTRDEARVSYVKPLAQQVDALGRVVFGPSFHVDINESLEIVSRTLDGRTIPIQSLSGGAKEQLAVIVRLACGQIVTRDDGGVPIILDDVLGLTDPDRRETMGAVLSEAGRTAQVIIFTCDPDRYRQVGGAHLIRLN
jgi:uncharacterized protein YhaN